MVLQENFVKNLKSYRKAQGLTQEKLAELCDTDTCYIGQIETLRRFPSLTLIEKIAKALQVEPHLLFMPQGKSGNIKKTKNSKKEIPYVEIKAQLTKIEAEVKKLREKI